MRLSFKSGAQYKFDIYGDWSLNFGDNNGDGLGDRDGLNIRLTGEGEYTISFNDRTLEYFITP